MEIPKFPNSFNFSALISLTKYPFFVTPTTSEINNNEPLPFLIDDQQLPSSLNDENDEMQQLNNIHRPIDQHDDYGEFELFNEKIDATKKVWDALFHKPKTVLQKIGKYGVDLIGLGPLYGSDYFMNAGGGGDDGGGSVVGNPDMGGIYRIGNGVNDAVNKH